MSSSSIYSPLMTVLLKALRSSCRQLARDYGEIEQLQPTIKGAGDFVQAASSRIDLNIINELQKVRPSFHLLSSESGYYPPLSLRNEDIQYYWSVNILDGKDNFWHALPYVTMSVAVTKHQEGQLTDVIAACIDAPLLRETYWAEKGKGAWLEKAGGTRGDRLRVSGRKQLSHALWSSDERDLSFFSDTLIQKNHRYFGCTSLESAYVASGKMDIVMLRNPSLNIAAPMSLLIREAGGWSSLLPTLPTESAAQNQNIFVVSNGQLQEGIMSTIKNMR
jgi:myo-inositol-1(or 4)-monophosphatase